MDFLVNISLTILPLMEEWLILPVMNFDFLKQNRSDDISGSL